MTVAAPGHELAQEPYAYAPGPRTRTLADVITVPLAHIVALADPLADNPWGSGAITAQDVRDEVTTPTVCDHPEPDWMYWDGCRDCDVRRIAWFVTQGVPGVDEHPILIDVGVGAFVPDWPLIDGNHRVAAAVVRGDPDVQVEWAGDEDRACSALIDGHDLWDLV